MQQTEHDLQPGGDDPVDEGVDEALEEHRLLEELDEVVDADELDVEQRPPGQAEVEGLKSGRRNRTAKMTAAGR